MKAMEIFLLILFSLTEQTAAQQDVFPPCFSPDNSSSVEWYCCNFDKDMDCASDFPLLLFGNCMTYNSTTETLEYGPCPYIAHYNNVTTVNGVFYIQLPMNLSLLNEFMCGPLN